MRTSFQILDRWLENTQPFVFGRYTYTWMFARRRTHRFASSRYWARQVLERRLTINAAHFTQVLKGLGEKTPSTLHSCIYERTMKIRYTTKVDSDVDYNPTIFADEVAVYLADPNGWVSEGYTFVRSAPADVEIHLSSPQTLATNGCRDGTLSCAELNGRHMHLNSIRWTRGAPPSKLDLKDYRQYMVTHEMGHILGHDHVKCPGRGQPAPLMMQQTLGIGVCSPNTKLTDSDRTKSR